MSFSISALVSAAVTGCLFGLFGRVVVVGADTTSAVVLWVGASFIAFVYGLAELLGVGLRVPSRHWLIPQRWAAYGSPRLEIIFGLILGTGFLTVVPFIGYYLLLASCVASSSLLLGSTLMVIFGVGRVTPVLLARVIPYVRMKNYNNRTALQVSEFFKEINRGQWIQFTKVSVLFLVAGDSVARVI